MLSVTGELLEVCFVDPNENVIQRTNVRQQSDAGLEVLRATTNLRVRCDNSYE